MIRYTADGVEVPIVSVRVGPDGRPEKPDFRSDLSVAAAGILGSVLDGPGPGQTATEHDLAVEAALDATFGPSEEPS